MFPECGNNQVVELVPPVLSLSMKEDKKWQRRSLPQLKKYPSDNINRTNLKKLKHTNSKGKSANS